MSVKSQEPVFFDDFTSPQLDRSKWNVDLPARHVNDELQAYIDSEETLYILPGKEVAGADDGVLVIHPRYKPGFVSHLGNTFDFVSGRVNTRGKVEFTYGTAAARIKLPAGPGLWPAFWALGTDKSWPDCGEIDIMEYVGETDWTSVALHGPGYSGETPLVNKVYFPIESDAADWHIYSVEWTPEGLSFKVDNLLVYRATRPMVEFYGPWKFDNSKFLILNFALGGIYPFKTNGVRQPYYGLPAPTAELIRENQAMMMIDWVRITRE